MSDKLTPEQRYGRDVEFHTLVDTIYSLIEQSQFTPTELREAVILACTMYEMRHCKSIFFVPQNEEEKD